MENITTDDDLLFKNSTDLMHLVFSTEDFLKNYTDYYGENVTDFTLMEEICEPNENQEMTAKVVQVVQVTLFVVVFVLGVIGNGLVIATFAKYRRLRLRCMTDIFLLYLALSDLLLLLTLPLQTGEVINGGWVFKDTLCKLNLGMYAINTYGGLLLLACISVDRYLVVVRARASQKLRPSMLCYSKLSAVAVALTSIFFSLPELIFSKDHKEPWEELGRCAMYVWVEDNSGRVKKLAYAAKITGFCVPCVAMLVCYSAIGNVLMQGRGKCWRRQRTLRLMGALVLLFLLFQLPYTLVLMYKMSVKPSTCEELVGVQLAEVVTRSLAYVRCCLNPVLYALMGLKFRNDVMRLLQDCGFMFACLSHMTPHSETGSSVTPSSPPPTVLSPLPSSYVPSKTATPPELQAVPNGSCPSSVMLLQTTFVSWRQR